ncbi:MAG: carboxypeptidase regulatory-like domain-containing protein [Gemmatimonadaceae bacterium]|nr:carboxypeptidase regulatory-like domain-containing protein [Gemmatimonadaceae bacterium]
MTARLRRALLRGLLVALPGTVCALGAAPAVVHAQVGNTTDILTGIVRGQDGKPIEGALVEAQSVETQVTRRQRTNAAGKYTILFPDGGGTYRVTIRHIGNAPVTVTLVRNGDDDRIVRNFQLGGAQAQQLAAVQVRARQGGNQGGPGGGPPTPGASERVTGGDQATRLPLDASDPTALAALSPGVVLTGADTSSGGNALSTFSVAGQGPTGNNVTLDGLSFAAGFVPQDAVRGTRVVTNTFDVARGQFSGGQVQQTTRSGTNVIQGSASYIGRYRDLTVEQGVTGAFGGAFNQNQFGAGLGFPIVKDRLFFFGALQGRRRSDLFPSLLAADSGSRARVGVAQDSVERFLGLVANAGIPTGSPVIDDNRNADNLTVLGRVDWVATDAHTVTFRGDWRLVDQDPTRIGPTSLPQTGGISRNRGGGGFVTLSSRFGTGLVNELRAGLQLDRRTSENFLQVPFGRVQVLSDLPDGSQGLSALSFGGNPALFPRSDATVFEATNETSALLGEGKHRVKLGGLLNRSSYEQDFAFNRFGTYTFNSLADFEANRAAAFTRTLASPLRTGATWNSAIYLGDTWRPNGELQLTFGLRAEGSRFSGAPALNPDVQQAFGRRTDRIPTDQALMPRLGFSFSPGATQTQGGGQQFGPFGSGRFTIRGGFGLFRDAPNQALFANAQTATGLTDAERQIFCVGPAVPAANWSAYALDPSAIPTGCAAGAPPLQRSTLPSVTLFDGGYGNPQAWRGSLGLSRRLFGRFFGNIDLSGVRGVMQTSVVDLNLNTTPQFTLAAEGGRPIFAPAALIVPGTGAVAVQGSRVDTRFGQVFEIASNNRSRQYQGTISITGFTGRGAIINTSYTYSNARDQSSLGFGGAGGIFAFATTGANPNVQEWAPSNFDRRHILVGTITHPIINGDGARNDRAFIFDPNGAGVDPALAAGVQRVIAGAPRQVRDCLTSQIGRIAARNSCRGPWQPSFDLQLNWRPTAFNLDRRLTVSLVTVNLVGGLDQLLHGSANLRGWGATLQPDQTLYFVRGFDAATQRYRYEVNERFGAVRGNAVGIRLPFQVGINMRYTIGPDQTRDRLRQVFGGGAGRGGLGAGIASGVGRFFPNIYRQLLEARDSIGFDEKVAGRLTTLADSLQVQVDSLAEQARKVVEKEGSNPDPAVLFGVKLRPFFEKGGQIRQATLKSAEALFTKEQWARVPARIKNPQGFGGPGGGPGGPGGGRPPF